MTSIKITNKDGIYETFTLTYNVVTGEEAITDIRGFSQNYGVDLITEQGARQQGSTTVGVTGKRRTISFVVHLFKRSREQLLERAANIVDYLNPHYGEVTIEHTNAYRTREIDGYLRRYEFNDQTNTGGYGYLTLTFECDEPFFKDADDTTQVIGTGEDVFEIFELDDDYTTPDFYFGEAPSGHPKEGDTVTQFGLNTQEIEVINTGNYMMPVFITIQGPVEDPSLSRTCRVDGLNVTDFLTFNLNSGTQEVTSNDYVEINTTQGRESATLFQYDIETVFGTLETAEEYKANTDSPTVYVALIENGDGTYTAKKYTKINLNKYLDPSSTYWRLNIGVNTINLESSASGTPIYTIAYRQRYISA